LHVHVHLCKHALINACFTAIPQLIFTAYWTKQRELYAYFVFIFMRFLFPIIYVCQVVKGLKTNTKRTHAKYTDICIIDENIKDEGKTMPRDWLLEKASFLLCWVMRMLLRKERWNQRWYKKIQGMVKNLQNQFFMLISKQWLIAFSWMDDCFSWRVGKWEYYIMSSHSLAPLRTYLAYILYVFSRICFFVCTFSYYGWYHANTTDLNEMKCFDKM